MIEISPRFLSEFQNRCNGGTVVDDEEALRALVGNVEYSTIDERGELVVMPKSDRNPPTPFVIVSEDEVMILLLTGTLPFCIDDDTVVSTVESDD